MNIFKLLVLPLCLLMLCPESFAQEAKKPKHESSDQAADKELEMQGLWAVREEDKDIEGNMMGGRVESIRISKDGTKYLIEIFGGMTGEYRTLALREGDQLKTGQMFFGNIIFSDDGERAYFGGSELRRVPDHKVRDFIEHNEAKKIRDLCILHVRNCQQAMRGEQNMKQLNAGDAFTRKDLEEYMQFPEDIKVDDGVIRFEPSNKIMPESGNPPVNDDHIWLKIVAPETEGNVGKYGFKDIKETSGW